jgi:hypothetical protein
MRTTLNLDPEVMTGAKRLAAQRGTTLTAVIEEAIRLELLRGVRPSPPAPSRLPTYTPSHAGLLPGVDLDDTDDLLDRLDGEPAEHQLR